MTSSALLALAETDFIRLTTFRRTGDPVGTAVWVVRDGDSLAVFTQKATGKVKRLRHTSRVTVVPCTRSGAVAEGAVPLAASATMSTETADIDRVTGHLTAKYGFQFRVFQLIEKIGSLRKKAREGGGRVIITIVDEPLPS